MLIFLPPSEGKAEPASGPAVRLDDLAFATELGGRRQELIEALAGLPTIDREEAVSLLGITANQSADVDRDAGLATAPAGPAIEVYSGVLFDRLDYPSLDRAARQRASDAVLIASALWGAVRPDDRIPWYRLSMKSKLPGVGGLAAFWRPALAEALASIDLRGEVVLDMRSGAYSAAWKPKAASLVSVRAFTEENGKRKTVSHMAKAVRGEVTRAILTAPRMPSDPDEVASLIEGGGRRVEVSEGFFDVIGEP